MTVKVEKFDREFVGFRQWNLKPNTDDLFPTVMDEVSPWVPGGVLEAKCHADKIPQGLFFSIHAEDDSKPVDTNHIAPKEDCSCGFYLNHRPRWREQRLIEKEIVIGIVVFWGTTAIHPQGIIRTRYVQVVGIMPNIGILVDRQHKVQLKRITDKYEIDLILPEYPSDVDDLLLSTAIKYGNLIPDRLVKEAEEISDMSSSSIFKYWYNNNLQPVPAQFISPPKIRPYIKNQVQKAQVKKGTSRSGLLTPKDSHFKQELHKNIGLKRT